MTEKRFIPIFDGTDKRVVGAKDNGKIISFMDMFDLLNDLSDENEKLKSTIIQFSSDFMNFKIKLLEQLRIHFDYASKQRQKNIGNHLLV